MPDSWETEVDEEAVALKAAAKAQAKVAKAEAKAQARAARQAEKAQKAAARLARQVARVWKGWVMRVDERVGGCIGGVGVAVLLWLLRCVMLLSVL